MPNLTRDPKLAGLIRKSLVTGTQETPLQPLPDRVDSAEFLSAIKKVVDVRFGTGAKGDRADMAVTFRDLFGMGLLGVNADGGGTIIGGIPGIPFIPPATPDPTVDDVAPPAPTGLTVSAAFRTVLLKWDEAPVPDKIGYTEIYASATNVLGSAVKIGASISRFFVDEVNAIGVGKYYWIRYVNRIAPNLAGPYNALGGTFGQTGMIGTVDLGPLIVEAGNLASGAVDYTKLSVAIGGGNLLRNSSFEAFDAVPLPANGWGAYNNSPGLEVSTITRVTGRRYGAAVRHAWTGSNTTTKGFYANAATSGGVVGGWQVGKRYVVSWWARANAAKTVGMALQWNTAPSAQVSLLNPNLDTTWQRYATLITWGGTVEASGQLFISIPSASPQTGHIEMDDVQVEEGDVLTAYAPTPDEILPGTIGTTEITDNAITSAKVVAGAIIAGKIAANAVTATEIAANSITAGKIAANAIAVGTAAIQNGAIVNAMIANATIDDAKISNLDAAKITTGFLDAARIQAGSLDANRITANTITATQMAANSIATASLQAGAVTAGKISVTTLDAITAVIGLLRTATSGARQEIASNYIKVFDASNVKRVQLGDLTA